MNEHLQLLVALQEFVREVNSVVNSTSERGMAHPDLDDRAGTLDSVLHALIEAENARIVAIAENL